MYLVKGRCADLSELRALKKTAKQVFFSQFIFGAIL